MWTRSGTVTGGLAYEQRHRRLIRSFRARFRNDFLTLADHTGGMANYHVVANFELQASIDRVWEALARPHWWEAAWAKPPQGDPPLQTATTRREPPELMEWRASGAVEGNGRWELIDLGHVTAARFTWKFRLAGARARLSAIFGSGKVLAMHQAALREAAEGLASDLGTTLCAFRSVSR